MASVETPVTRTGPSVPCRLELRQSALSSDPLAPRNEVLRTAPHVQHGVMDAAAAQATRDGGRRVGGHVPLELLAPAMVAQHLPDKRGEAVGPPAYKSTNGAGARIAPGELAGGAARVREACGGAGYPAPPRGCAATPVATKPGWDRGPSAHLHPAEGHVKDGPLPKDRIGSAAQRPLRRTAGLEHKHRITGLPKPAGHHAARGASAHNNIIVRERHAHRKEQVVNNNEAKEQRRCEEDGATKKRAHGARE
eukprot:scaffold6568_cov126-Isochrysis_galbana.AAC.1